MESMAAPPSASVQWSADTLDRSYTTNETVHPKEIAEMRRKNLRAKQAKKTVEQLEDDAKRTVPKSLHELGQAILLGGTYGCCSHMVWRAGNECYEMGEFQNAIIYYSRAIAVDPSDPRLYSNRSACFTVLQMYGRAINDALVRGVVVSAN
jgi:tetratricopeptide (TPR) repeat protein